MNALQNKLNHHANWYILIPEKTLDLKKMHEKAKTILKDPKNSHGNKYDPHITLMNSTDIQKEQRTSPLDNPLTARFQLAILDRDKVGQARKILRCNPFPAEEKRFQLSI